MSDVLEIAADPAFGSVAALARLCGVTRQAASKWKRLPAEFCRRVEHATEGRWDRYRLRPDVFGEAQTFAKSHEEAPRARH